MSNTPRTDFEAEGANWFATSSHSIPAAFARQLEREIAVFCRVMGEDNPVSAMVELKTMKRELAEANARLDWIRRNCEIHFDQGASTRMIEDIDEIDALILDQWDRDNIDDEINRKENQNG